MRNKKGSLSDAIFLVVALFIIAIVGIVGWKIMEGLNNKFQAGNELSAEGKSIFQGLRDRYVSIVDNSFLISLVGLIIAIGIGSFFIKTHPALFWISVPIMAFIVFLAAIYANVFNSIATDNGFSTEVSSFTIIPFVFQHYVIIITGVVLIVTTLLFAKNNFFNEQ